MPFPRLLDGFFLVPVSLVAVFILLTCFEDTQKLREVVATPQDLVIHKQVWDVCCVFWPGLSSKSASQQTPSFADISILVIA